MKKFFLVTVLCYASLFLSCSSGGENKQEKTEEEEYKPETPVTGETSTAESANKGVGKFTHVELTTPLNQEWVKNGESIYQMKCLSCHKLTSERLVGPGWGGVTDRRTPEWIMNFVTNVEMMLEKDPAAQKLLEECLVRMPNQNLSEADARAMLEFMRKNDGET